MDVGAGGQVAGGQEGNGAQGGDVLGEVAALRVGDTDAAHARGGCGDGLQHADGQADGRRDQDGGEGAEQLPVHDHAQAGEFAADVVDLGPGGQRVGEGHVLGVGQVVGDAAALEGGDAAGHGGGEEFARVGGAVPDFQRDGDQFVQFPSALPAVGDQRVAVEGAVVGAQGPGGVLEAAQPGVRVDGEGEKVGAAFGFQLLEQEGHFAVPADPAARLQGGASALPGTGQHLGGGGLAELGDVGRRLLERGRGGGHGGHRAAAAGTQSDAVVVCRASRVGTRSAALASTRSTPRS